MKKVFVSLMLALAVAAGASAQSWKDMLGKVAGEVVNNVASNEKGGAVANILGSLLGNSMTLSPEAIEGTWSYEGVACILESENALSNIGGTLVTGQLESKLDEMLAKVGVKKGNCSFVFKKDGACSILVGGYTIEGTYVLNPDEKVMNFSFMYGNMNLKTYVAYEIQNLNVVFNADKLLAFIKNITSALSKNSAGQQLQQLNSISSAAGSIGTLLNAYDGMMLGAKLARVASEAPATQVVEPAEKPAEDTSSSSKFNLGNLFK